MTEAVRLIAAHRRRGSFELGPIDLTVEAGTWLAVEGRSGSGKSTLLGLLGALDRLDSGSVELFGCDVTDRQVTSLASLRRGRIGHLHQAFAFADHLPVWQSVSSRLVPVGVGRAERRERARLALEKLDAEHVLERMPGELSGGEAQRAALARALIDTPDLVVADEPTSNVDEATAASLLEALAELRALGSAIVTATHDALVVQESDVRIQLESGRIVR